MEFRVRAEEQRPCVVCNVALDEHNMNACSKAVLVLPFIILALLLPPDATVFDVACSIFLIARVSIVPYFAVQCLLEVTCEFCEQACDFFGFF